MLYPNSFDSDLWINSIARTYGYKLFYLNGENQEKGPVVAETRSLFFKSKGISFPFSDHYSFPVENPEEEREYINKAIKLGQRRNWNYFEYRGIKKENGIINGSAEYYLHILDLKNPLRDINAHLKKRIQRNIRKGEQIGIEVSFLSGRKEMMQFYKLHCRTRKRHGVPPQPYLFFKNIYKNFIENGQGFIARAIDQGKVLSAMIFLMNGSTAIYKFGASSKQGLKERASYKLMWDAICHLKTEYNVEQLDLGRTSVTNKGLLLFKDGWTTSRLELTYSIYPIKAEESESRDIRKLERLFKHCPLPILRLIGTVLYRFAA